MAWLPDPLHPAIVHFPIALALVALLFELLARHPRLRGLESGALALFMLAAVAAVVAVLTGNAAHGDAVVPTGARGLVETHEEIGEFAMWWLLGLAAVRVAFARFGRYVGWKPWVVLLLAAVGAGLVSYNGYLGGKMVFDHGIGTSLSFTHPAASD